MAKVGGARTYHLKRRYGITAADADAILTEQDGLCAICCTAAAAHVDHDHSTGKVRGLLCFNCNGGLGQFKARIDVLQAAVAYLKDHVGSAPSESTLSSSPSTKSLWPPVIELFPYRGADVEVARSQHRIGA